MSDMVHGYADRYAHSVHLDDGTPEHAEAHTHFIALGPEETMTHNGWWYTSVVDTTLPEGMQFLGILITQARDLYELAERMEAWGYYVNGITEVAALPVLEMVLTPELRAYLQSVAGAMQYGEKGEQVAAEIDRLMADAEKT